MKTIKSTFIVTLIALSFAAHGADAPPDGEKRSLADGLIEFITPPSPAWISGVVEPSAQSAVFTTKDRLGQMALLLLPKDAADDANAAVAIVKDRRAKREKEGAKVILPATVEKDARFAIRIHEKFKVGSKTQDSLYLYRNVGPRVMELLVSTLSDDTDEVTASQTAGESVLLSAKFNRLAMK